MWQYNYTNELYHHGVKGMKWGVRKYQNPDGTLTSAGKKRYAESIKESLGDGSNANHIKTAKKVNSDLKERFKNDKELQKEIKTLKKHRKDMYDALDDADESGLEFNSRESLKKFEYAEQGYFESGRKIANHILGDYGGTLISNLQPYGDSNYRREATISEWFEEYLNIDD